MKRTLAAQLMRTLRVNDEAVHRGERTLEPVGAAQGAGPGH